LLARRYPPPLPCIAPVSYPTEKLELSLLSTWIFPGSPPGGIPANRCTRRQFGSLQFPSYPFKHMPWSQTPAVPRTLAISRPGLLPSAQWIASAFILHSRTYPNGPQLYIFRGSIHSLCSCCAGGTSRDSVAPDSRLRVCLRTSLLTWLLVFSQGGLGSIMTLTHWVTLSNFIPCSGSPIDLSLTRHDIRFVR
jgi:hypothetical protein